LPKRHPRKALRRLHLRRQHRAAFLACAAIEIQFR
jgi:hypothetical protein